MAVSTNEFLDIQAMIERGFTLKCMRDTIRIYSQTHFTDSTHNPAQSFGQFGKLLSVCSQTKRLWVRVT